MRQDDSPTIRATQVSGNLGETAKIDVVSPSLPTEPVTGLAQPGASQQTMMLNQPTPALAWLAVLNGAHQGHLFSLYVQGTSIGRDAQNDIVLDDSAVSRQHAKLRFEEGARKSKQFFVYDLASSNGTQVNGQKIVRKALNDGDRIRIGETEMVFKTVDAAPAKPAAKRRAKRASKATASPKKKTARKG